MLHADCMEFLLGQPDGAFDLAVVDPPYGIGVNSMNMGGRQTIRPDERSWDSAPPPKAYFEELMRVSKDQIIWGGNYFDLPPKKGFFIWDKGETMYGRDFAECEMAWSTLDIPAKIFKLGPNQPERIHPTQKPVALYKWLLTRYAKPGQRILDTHGGSGSDCIAVHDVNADLVSRGLEPMTLTWMELDADYYAAAVKRYETHAAQLHLFDPAKKDEPENLPLDL